MAEIDKDLPAFPVPCVSQNNGSGETVSHQSYGGMTLRDYFAAKSLPTMLDICRLDSRDEGVSLLEHVAENAYAIADAMLVARGGT